MLIGDQYSDNRIYRGIRFYDHLPLASGDLHEYTDTVYMKNAYLMNNIIGYGILNNLRLNISSSGVSILDPAVLIIDGDISLIQSDDNSHILPMRDIIDYAENEIGIPGGGSSGSNVTPGESIGGGSTSESTNTEIEGALCIIGWYQEITANSTMRNYGGVKNSIIDNNLVDNEFKVQLSSRYQFRWTTEILPLKKNIYGGVSQDSIKFHTTPRNATGDIDTNVTSFYVQSREKNGNIFIADPPAGMNYAASDLYIIPLIKFKFDANQLSLLDVSAYLPITPKGSSGFISSETEPIGEYVSGTTWYNPITREFRTYVTGDGFVSSTSTMGFLQYQSVYTFSQDFDDIQDILVPIYIDELQDGDILQIVYEGLTLTADEHYTINYDTHVATLLGFTAKSGEKVTFTCTKIVEASDVTNITATFTKHMSQIGSSTVSSHVKLSDDTDSPYGENNGVAATPKAVRDSKILNDATTGVHYKFGVDNGLVFIEEV